MAAIVGPVICALFHGNQCAHPGLHAALTLAVESSTDDEALLEKMVKCTGGSFTVGEILERFTPQI